MPISETQRRVMNENAGSTSSASPLEFPLDYGETSGHWFVLDEYEYSRPSASSNATPKQTGTTIKLPIPRNLMTNYSANWGEQELGAFGNAVRDVASNIINNARNGVQTSADDIVGKFGKIQEAVKSELTADTFKKLGVGVGVDSATQLPFADAALMAGGYARNPFVAVMFSGVNLRGFRFDYHFFPKSYQEFLALEKIIKALKYGMHPSYDETFQNYLFKYPNMYKPSFTQSQHLFSFGFSVINDVFVDYHGEGVPLYIEKDGVKIPASIRLSFSIKEMEIITKETIDKQNSTTTNNTSGSTNSSIQDSGR